MPILQYLLRTADHQLPLDRRGCGPEKVHLDSIKSSIWRLGSNPSAATYWLGGWVNVTSHSLSFFTCKMGIKQYLSQRMLEDYSRYCPQCLSCKRPNSKYLGLRRPHIVSVTSSSSWFFFFLKQCFKNRKSILSSQAV